MNNNDFVKEKLQILDEVEIPNSVTPKVLMAKLEDKKQKPVSKITVLQRVVLVAAAVALFFTGAFAINRNNTSSLQFPVVTNSVGNVRFFTSNDEIIDAVEPFIKNDFRLFDVNGAFGWTTGADTAVMEKATDYVYTNAIEDSIAEVEPTEDGNHSTTNVQVGGVMEADTVITDGKYIYAYRTDVSGG